MAQVFFHVEVEQDVLEDEWPEVGEGRPMPTPAQLEAQSIEFVAGLFGSPVNTHGRRHDALICSVKVKSLEHARRVIRENSITEGSDQITSGVEYVIVRDFETRE